MKTHALLSLLFLTAGMIFPSTSRSSEPMNHGDDYRKWLKYGADAIGVSQIAQCRPKKSINFLSCKDPLLVNAPSRCRIVGSGDSMAKRKIQIGVKVTEDSKTRTVFKTCAEVLLEAPAPENRGCEVTIRSCPFLEKFVNAIQKKNSKTIQILQNGLAEDEPDLVTSGTGPGLPFQTKGAALSSAGSFPGTRTQVMRDASLSALVKRKKLPPPPDSASTLVFTDTGFCRQEVTTDDGNENAESEMIVTTKSATQCCSSNDTGLEDIETRLEYWTKFCTLQVRTYGFSTSKNNGPYRSGEGATPTLIAPAASVLVKQGDKKKKIKFIPITVRSLGD